MCNLAFYCAHYTQSPPFGTYANLLYSVLKFELLELYHYFRALF